MRRDVRKGMLPLQRVLLVILSVGLFILALQMIRYSLQDAEISSLPMNTIKQFFNSEYRSFIVGWFGNTIVLSGSPIAALGISLFASGFQTDPSSLAAIIFGSRAGPDLIMFIVGTAILIKGKTIAQSFSIGIIEFFTTLSITVLSLLLYNVFFTHLDVGAAVINTFGTGGYSGVTEHIINPIAQYLVEGVGPLLGLILGLGILIAAIFTFDKFFAFVTLKPSEQDPTTHSIATRWYYKRKFKWTMEHSGRMLRWMNDYMKLPFMAFLLGALITGATLSVAISVSLVLPFYAYGLITERSAIAYILAANVTTFIDTFFIAILTHNPTAISVVTGVIYSVTLTVAIYLIGFRYYARFIAWLMHETIKSPWRIFAVMGAAVLFPTVLFFT